MTKEYTDLQLLRSLIETVGNDGEGSADQVVLDIVSWLSKQAPANEAYQEIFDIVAKNYSPMTELWDFE
jgi:hypothetical protein